MANKAGNNILANPPALTGSQPTWLVTLREAINKTITPDAIEKMLLAQVEKAKEGDAKALKLVMELAAQQPQQAVNATQNVFHVHLPAGATANEDPVRVKVFAALEALGPMSPQEIASNTGLDKSAVEESLDHPWFAVDSRGGHPRRWTIAGKR